MINSALEKFDTLTPRERVIIIATIMITIWGAWDNFIYQPLATEQKALNTKLSTLKINLSANQQVAKQIEALGEIDPNKENKLILKEIKQQFQQLKLKINTGDKKFVPAHLMPKVLQDLLQQNSGLKILDLKTLAKSTFSSAPEESSWIYRHGLSITLSGNYFNTLRYLEALEALPWRFNWESIDYQVKEYPIAETTLNVYTLSFEENWLGL